MSSHYLEVILRFGAAVLVVTICAYLFAFSPRLVALPIAAAMIVTLIMWICGKRGRYAGILLAAFVVVSLSPVDVRPQHWFGAPKVVPYLLGYPSREMFEAEERGEVMLGGCISSGNDPRWVLTW